MAKMAAMVMMMMTAAVTSKLQRGNDLREEIR